MALYLFQNGAMSTTAAPVKVTTGTAIKTLLQVKTGANVMAKIVEWGISFDGSSLATPIECELVETGTVFATVTAFVANDIVKYDDPNAVDPTQSYVALTTTGSGYTSTAEGTITATREFDFQLVLPTNQYVKQFPLGQQPKVNAGSSLRIRVTAGAAVNAYCYVILEF